MPTCNQLIQAKINLNEIDSITALLPNTAMPISISVVNKQLFRFENQHTDTIVFNLFLQSAIPITSSLGVAVSFYWFDTDNNIIQLVGTSIITEMIMSFQQEFTPGFYFICISSSRFSLTGTLTGLFSGYVSQPRLKPLAYAGEWNETVLTKVPREVRCDQLILFSLVDGSLPPGMVVTIGGNVEGLVPDMDCIDDNADLSPSINWFYNVDGDKTWGSWARRWRFRVRAWIPSLLVPWNPLVEIATGERMRGTLFTESDPVYYDGGCGETGQAYLETEHILESAAYEWFCLEVFNNWSWDKDRFMSTPLEETFEFLGPVPDVKIPPLEEPCCEEAPVVKEKFTPTPIAKTAPCPCDEELPNEEQITRFIAWYRENANNEDNADFIRLFVNKFKGTDIYDRLMRESGIAESMITDEERARAEDLRIERERQERMVLGRNTTDYDYLYLREKDIQNQKLPMTPILQSGECLEIQLA